MTWMDRQMRGKGRCKDCQYHHRLYCAYWDHEALGSMGACVKYTRADRKREVDHARVDRDRDRQHTWKPDRVTVARDADAEQCQRVPTANGDHCPRCGGRVLGTTERQCWVCGWVQYGDGVRDSVSGPFWPPLTMAIPGTRRGD